KEGVWYGHEYQEFLAGKQKKMPDDYVSGYTNDTYFKKVDGMTFVLRANNAASDALESFFKGLTIADCGSVASACHYKAFLDILGKEKFNQIFAATGPYPLVISAEGFDSGIDDGILASQTIDGSKRLIGTIGNRLVQVGEECHFGGVQWYLDKHPNGHLGGYNVICVGKNSDGKQLFLGFGFKKPLTEEEIYDLLLDGYNLERSEEDKLFIEEDQEHSAYYDTSSNPNLRSLYTIERTKNRAEFNFLKGFIPGAQRAIIASNIRLLKEKDIREIGGKLPNRYP
ncbi:MAG TPA: hypothetical protein VN457_00340, partial [Chlamydiales bacterium]|nr:hypothetical protein [Chlamydiales bacterium]